MVVGRFCRAPMPLAAGPTAEYITGVQGVLWLLLEIWEALIYKGLQIICKVGPCLRFLLAAGLKLHLIANLTPRWLKALLKSIFCCLVQSLGFRRESLKSFLLSTSQAYS